MRHPVRHLVSLPMLAAALLMALAASGLEAQQVAGTTGGVLEAGLRDAGGIVRKQAEAARLEGPAPVVDGSPDEAIWRTAPVITDFVQYEPLSGAAPGQRTELRILYGGDALYVAAWMYDTAPDSIVGQLTRRDQHSFSDRILLSFDSYQDRRTAFDFALNPMGVKLDIYRFDDTNEDSGWDAVWDGAAATAADGWTAEFRIPFSQLRFAAGAGEHTWGFNAMRTIARTNETTVWAPLSRQTPGVVSRFGDLTGLANLPDSRRIEITPYALARGERVGGDPANPFWSATQGAMERGGDLRRGGAGNLPLNLAVSADFGQVEADPSQVNLTAFETFLPERRPFFVEGANIFSVRLAQGDGDGASESLFYSRRIGRAPQGSVDDRDGFVDHATQTRILAAWKLSGKTEGGLSLGLMHAATAREEADIFTGEGERLTETVEPFTNYVVGRVQQDFRNGESAVGLVTTATNREEEGADALGLRTGAYTAGIDARHRWGGGNFQVAGALIGSHIRGSEEAILSAQRAPARYFQRPDAGHLSVDSAATSMSGWTGMWEVGKIGGGFWRFATGGRVRSPGFEVNDLGFMQESDFVSPWIWVGHHRSVPGRIFRNWGANLNGWTGWTFGGERTNLGGNINVNGQLHSFWSGYAGINRDMGGLSTGMLRGGPTFRREPGVNGWGGINSDSRRAVQVSWNNNWSVRRESDSWSYNTSMNVRWRPSGRMSLNAGPFWNRRLEDRQWVARVTTGEGAASENHYVFGRLDQTTAGMTARLDVAFTPDITLQLYAQPFLASGSYGDFKRVDDPTAERYADRFQALESRPIEEGERHAADLDGDGVEEDWRNPDFSTLQFRSNAVLRWEYRPGSALFLVWAQARDQFSQDGNFDLGGASGDLFGQRPDNVFMIKASYWLNP